MTTLAGADRCPCTSGEIFAECCGRFLSGAQTAPTAEALMRSRFSAFAVGDVDYLLKSWHSATRPASLELDAGMTWRRLVINNTSDGGPFDSVGTVDFSAHYRFAGEPGERAQPGVQRELSRFVREEGQWFYLDGVEAE